MENLFKKFFGRQARLVSSEWPPSEPQTDRDAKAKIDDLKRRLAELNSQKDWNDWTVEDRQMAQHLEDEINVLEKKLESPAEGPMNQSVADQTEDSEVKKRLDDLMKKVRG